MGVAIHYRGSMDDLGQIEEKMNLINEKMNELQIDLATGSFGDLTADQIADRIEIHLKNQR